MFSNNEISQTPITVPSYSTEKSVYLGSELFNVRYKLSAIAQKVLFTLAQRLVPTAELFPLWTIDIRTLFECCGLVENNHRRYGIIREALHEIGANPLQRRDSTDLNWKSVYWFDSSSFDVKSMNITISFGHSVKEYLLQFNKYVEIKPRYYKNLGNYAMYLYPMLKNELFLSKKFSKYEVVVDKDIDYLKSFMYCDKIKSYNDNSLFLSNVIGIQRKPKSEETSKTEEWTFATKKVEGKDVVYSALKEICDFTDIQVSAYAVKKGKAYEFVRFTVSLKQEGIEDRVAKNEYNAAKVLEAKTEIKKERLRF